MLLPGAVAASIVSLAESPIITVTEGTWTDGLGTSKYGFADSSDLNGPFGSVLPATYGGGNTIKTLYYLDGTLSDEFAFVLVGSHAQSFFTDLTPQDGLTLTSAGVFSYSQSLGNTYWRWNGVTIPARWDGAGTSTVTFT